MAKRLSSSLSESEASKFMSTVNDDLLLEVFLRVPHRQSLIQCSMVCKRWFSLISHSQFSRRFIEFHNHKPSHDSLPYALLFRASLNARSLGEIVSKKSNTLHGKEPNKEPSSSDSCGLYQNILPPNTNIKASCEDLLLLSNSVDQYTKDQLGICNPLTKQLLWLPCTPLGRYFNRSGLVCKLNKNSDQYSFRVLQMIEVSDEGSDYALNGAIFCSEAKEWRKSIFSLPKTIVPQLKWVDQFIATDGILYAPLRERFDVKGFVAFDLFLDSNSKDDPKRCRFINLPHNIGRGWRTKRSKVCYGVVQGRVRLSQMVRISNMRFDLKVWELHSDDNDVEWVLVYHVRLKSVEKTSMGVVAFHPNNGDEIFMLRNLEVYKYKIGEEKYKRVGELLAPEFPESLREDFSIFFRAFTLVYPSWPTTIPNISNCLRV